MPAPLPRAPLSQDDRYNKQMGLTRRAVRNMQALSACMFAFTGVADAAVLNFCWVGGGGYTMTGRMALPDSAMRKPMVTEKDITAFEITGYRNGTRVGHWNLEDKTPRTTWFLRFEPETLRFPVGGSFGSPVSQGWNADGTASDCGSPGFGFNSGNRAQDVCVGARYMTESSIPPATPFVATYDAVTPDCAAAPNLSLDLPPITTDIERLSAAGFVGTHN